MPTPPIRSIVIRYGGATLAVAVATLVRFAMAPILGASSPYVTFVVAVLAAAWYGGLGPALYSLVLGSVAATCFFILPFASQGVGLASQAAGVFLFTFVGITTALLTESLRRARLRAEAIAGEVLREREWLRVTLESIGDAVVTVDPEGRIASMNRVAEALTGRGSIESTGRPLAEVVRVVDPATGRPIGLGIGGRVEGIAVVGPDGTPRAIEATVAPIRDGLGRESGVVLVLRDVQERRQADLALRQSERRFRQLADTIPQVVWTAEPDGGVDYFNGWWYAYSGMTPEGSLTDDGWRRVVHPDDLDAMIAARRDGIDRSEFFETKCRLRDRTGAYRWHVLRSVPALDDSGRVFRRFGTATDVHDLMEMEEALREADRRKDLFLATLAHELRNPLAPIRNTLLRAGRSDGFDAERAMAERHVSHLARLVDDLMDVSRINQNKISLKISVVDLKTAVRAAVESVGDALRENGHALDVGLPDRPIRLEADATRLDQVLWNLLNNAIKYTEPGGRIALSVEPVGGEVVVRVRDNGTGIDPAVLPRVFEMFVQGRGQPGPSGGLGIGLGLVRSLVELHGGSVTAASDGPGLGSEFTVRLPILADAPAPAGADASARPSGPRPRRRILVVDDNKDAALTLAKLMERAHGQEVRVAHDGPTALALAGEFRPELVLLDIGMPGMDGYETARRFRADDALGRIFLAALTGWGGESDRARSREAGFDRHWVKPVDPGVILELLPDLPRARA